MPELPEVETTVRGLEPVLEGQVITRSPCTAPTCGGRFRRIWGSG
jgi:formamidopyrimidine-DNA glycosylase